MNHRNWFLEEKMNTQKITLGDEILRIAHAVALSELKESRWFQSAPEKFREQEPGIKFTSIEYHAVTMSSGGLNTGTRSAPFICGETIVGGISAKIRLRLDFGIGGFVVEEHS